MDLRRALQAGAVALGSLAVVTSAMEPTGVTAVDVVYRGVVGAAVAGAASRARRGPLTISAAAVALVARTGAPWWALAAGVGGVASAVRPAERTARAMRWATVVGAVMAGAAARASVESPYGTTGALVLAALAPVLVSGYRESRRRTRRWVRTTAIASVAAGLVLAGAALGAVGARRTALEEAIAATEEGLEAARDGRNVDAAAALGRATERFDEVVDLVGAVPLLPARLVPLAGPHLRAVHTVVEDGRDLTAEAAAVADAAGVERLRLVQGQLDLDVVREVHELLASTTVAAERAQRRANDLRSTWLVAPLRDRLDTYRDALADALPDLHLATAASDALPTLLGGSGPTRYLVAFLTPAEARGLGGFLGNWAEITATSGRLELTATGRSADLRPPSGTAWEITGQDDYLERWGRFRPGEFVQDIPMSPDFPTVADVLHQVYEQATDRPVDGVVVVDPLSLASLIELTGPIDVPGANLRLQPDEVAEFLLRGQYERYDDDDDERTDALDTIVRATFTRLVQTDLPSPRAVTDVLGPRVDEGRLLVTSRDRAADRFLRRVGLGGELPPVDGDFLAVTHQNVGQNKIDTFLERTVAYDLDLDPATGEASGTVTITLHNSAPPSGMADAILRIARDDLSDADRPPPGTNLARLSVYSALLPRSATVDGEPLALEVGRELARPVAGAVVAVPPGGTTVVEVAVAGTLPVGDAYRLGVAPQPVVTPDRYEVQVDVSGESLTFRRTPEGADQGGGTVTWRARTDTELVADVPDV